MVHCFKNTKKSFYLLLLKIEFGFFHQILSKENSSPTTILHVPHLLGTKSIRSPAWSGWTEQTGEGDNSV